MDVRGKRSTTQRNLSGEAVEIISESNAKPRLQPHHNTIIQCVQAGWGKWMEYVAPHLPLPERRTRPTVVHNFITDEARRRFCDVPGVSVISAHGRFLLTIDGQFVIYFKQIDRALRTRNYPTETALKFDTQQPIGLPGIPDICRITIGYIPSTSTQSITAIYAMLLCGKNIKWSYDIAETHQGQLLTFPQLATMRPPSAPKARYLGPTSQPKSPRIRPKKTTENANDASQPTADKESGK